MHGLVNRAIQCFVRDTYGENTWAHLARVSEAPRDGFEAMFLYDNDSTLRMLWAAESVLGKTVEHLLEDLGTYLVANPRNSAVRRLLRFGGESFIDFLLSIDDLPRRAALAVPDLDLPTLTLNQVSDAEVHIFCRADDGMPPVFGNTLVGLIRTMADEYGALAVLDHCAVPDGERITVRVLSTNFADARPFQLAAER